MKLFIAIVAGLVTSLALFSSGALAVTPNEMLADPALEARAREISQTLRCVVCQNQSIDDSNAPLAKDLRVLVRERLTAGDTDAQTVGYIVARYGNFVLLRPPVQTNTLLLWFGPILMLGLSAYGLIYILNRQASITAETEADTRPLSKLDEQRLATLLGGTGATAERSAQTNRNP